MPHILVVAYGNPLRSDDGIAWRVAQALQAKFSSDDVEILCLHQLAPELAESAGLFDGIIFLDAASGPIPGEVRIEEIAAHAPEQASSHALTPAAVLSLAARLYNARPRSFAITVTGHNFDHGESLSPPVAAALPDLISRIESLLRSLAHSEAIDLRKP